MERTIFNPARMELLEMMSFVDSPEALSQLKKVISDYFAKQTQEKIDRLWESGQLDEKKWKVFVTYMNVLLINRAMQNIVLDTNSLIMSISAKGIIYSSKPF